MFSSFASFLPRYHGARGAPRRVLKSSDFQVEACEDLYPRLLRTAHYCVPCKPPRPFGSTVPEYHPRAGDVSSALLGNSRKVTPFPSPTPARSVPPPSKRRRPLLAPARICPCSARRVCIPGARGNHVRRSAERATRDSRAVPGVSGTSPAGLCRRGENLQCRRARLRSAQRFLNEQVARASRK